VSRGAAVQRAVRGVERGLLAGAILAIAALTCLNVFTRTAFGVSLAAVEEVSGIGMLVVTFVGLSYAAGQGRHIRMTALTDALPAKPRKVLLVFTHATTALLLVGLAGIALAYIDTLYTLGTASPALGIPLWIPACVVPVGCGLAAVQYALAVVRNATHPGTWLSWDVSDAVDEPTQPGL
jgi:TRAP-type C4-dicarboxylate transport system permease small subunit